MLDLLTFFARHDRVQVYRPGLCDEQGQYVLYWMQRAQRGRDNHALNAAIELANALHLPVVVAFVLTAYPAANLRHYQFMLEGLELTAHHLKERGTPLVIRCGEPVEEITRLAQELRAAAVISDECELRLPRGWRAGVAQKLTVPFACVDADVVVPTRSFPKEEWAAYTLRPRLTRLLPTYLQPIVNLEPVLPLAQPPCDAGATADPLSYLQSLPLDRSVKPSPIFKGGYDEGQRRLHHFVQERLAAYAEHRNEPALAGTSELSAYLHFGQVSVQQVAWTVEQYIPSATGSAYIDVSGGRAAYLEQLIVRRELAINFVLHNPHYDSLEGCPEWGRETLRKHVHDPRPWCYSLEDLEQAKTHDQLWNACQREMLLTGRMHGYMRMYWAKKILEWTETPEEAFQYAIYLNDKYELDGRDANGYTGIAWSIGGKHDRPWAPERPIFGLIRYMSLDGMRRKMDIKAYIDKWSE
jgi:deoxyribodipyrimidine photo-lyase